MEPREQDADNLQRALTVGCCGELLQTFFLVTNNIIDASLTCRGQVCWYQKPGIDLEAISDAILLEVYTYSLLKHYSREQPCYVNLIELFLQSSYQTGLGRPWTSSQPPRAMSILADSLKKYKSIIKYKTAFHSFYLPVTAAMYMAGIGVRRSTPIPRKSCWRWQSSFRFRMITLTSLGTPVGPAKLARTSKCSRLVVQCLQRATLEQNQILKENYGQKEAGKLTRVKAPYEELDLPAVFLQYEEDSYSHIMGLIEQCAVPLPPAIFLGLAPNSTSRKSDLETARV
ncbi:hypothetical protein H8958_010619 [Nasalis larvatus]